jgi:hypothetical protein
VLFGDSFERGFGRGGVGDVEGEGAGEVGKMLGCRFQPVGFTAMQDDSRASTREAGGDGPADASGTAGDEGRRGW